MPSHVTPACATRPMRAPASAATARGEGSATETPRARRSGIARSSPGSGRSPSHPPGPTSGSARGRTATSRPRGRDARGRKQYRYHARLAPAPRQRQVRSHARLRRRSCRGSGAAATPTSPARGLSREKVLAAVVRLLELTLIRVGNDEYARLNRSFGLTTLRDRHAKVEGGSRPVPVPREIRDRPTRSGFATADSRGWSDAARSCPARSSSSTSTTTARSATSARTTSTTTSAKRPGREFSAKDFRTWAGTVLAYRALRALQPADGERGGEAERRRGDPADRRPARQHPGRGPRQLRPPGRPRGLPRGLDPRGAGPGGGGAGHTPDGSDPREEAAVRALLRQRLEDDAARSGRRGARRSGRAERRSGRARKTGQAADS